MENHDLLKEICEFPLYSGNIVTWAIRTGYSNEKILKAISGGIVNAINSYNEKIFASDNSSGMRRIHRIKCIKCKNLQEILKQEGLSDGKKLHYYMKAVNLSTLSELDTFVGEITHENKFVQ